MAELTREGRLAVYLAEAARRQFDPARWTCLLGFVSNWVDQEVPGADIAAPWRGRYKTAIGMQRIIRREGGVVAIMSSGCARAGLLVTSDPQPGDIGVVMSITALGVEDVGAIRTARGWACLAAGGGVTVGQNGMRGAWSLG